MQWSDEAIVLGVALGCLNAWYWAKKVREKIIGE